MSKLKLYPQVYDTIPDITTNDVALKYRVSDVRLISSTFQKEIQDDD